MAFSRLNLHIYIFLTQIKVILYCKTKQTTRPARFGQPDTQEPTRHRPRQDKQTKQKLHLTSMARPRHIPSRVVLQPLGKQLPTTLLNLKLVLNHINLSGVGLALHQDLPPGHPPIVHDLQPNAAFHLLLMPDRSVIGRIQPFDPKQPHDGSSHEQPQSTYQFKFPRNHVTKNSMFHDERHSSATGAPRDCHVVIQTGVACKVSL
jgi:hypothetical protein